MKPERTSQASLKLGSPRGHSSPVRPRPLPLLSHFVTAPLRQGSITPPGGFGWSKANNQMRDMRKCSM